MTWREAFDARKAQAAWIACSLGLAALGALAIGLVAGGANAGAQGLTVALPPAVSDTIYAAPMARGRPIVVLDPGHGGRDPGARGVEGNGAEKDLTLALASELRDLLVKNGRVRVAMTRDDDRYLALDERAAVARRLNAASFVSLHMDSAANPLARGASVYSLSDVASDAEAAALAATHEPRRRAQGARRIGRGAAVRPRDARADARLGRPRDAAGRQIRGPVRACAPSRTNSPLSTSCAARARRRCCSRPAISAMPTTRRCCARPPTARRWSGRWPRRSKPTSPPAQRG